jgi:hypothetical protein
MQERRAFLIVIGCMDGVFIRSMDFVLAFPYTARANHTQVC